MQYSFFDFATARTRRFTDGASTNIGACWSADGSAVAFSSNARDGTHFDVYLLAIAHVLQDQPADAHARLIMQNSAPGYFWTTGAATRPDGSSTLLVHHYTSVSDSALYLVETSAAHQTHTTKIAPCLAHPAAVGSARLVLADDGLRVRGVLYSSNEGSDFLTLRFWDAKEKSSLELCPEALLPWDVENFAVDSPSGVFVAAYNVDGCSQLYCGRLASSPPPPAAHAAAGENAAAAAAPAAGDGGLVQLDVRTNGVIGSLELCADACGHQGLVLGYSILAANAPYDVYIMCLGSYSAHSPHAGLPHNPPPTRWTESEVGGLNTALLVSPSLVRIKSFDGLVFSSFVYRPRPPGAGDKRKCGGGEGGEEKACPVIIHPHGGPEGQHRPRFSPLLQFLVCELGVCVIDPNVRGSDGYGKEFVNLDNGYKREDSVKDLGALLDWIARDPTLDASRVAVWGGSYGGYMVLAALVHYSARLKCGMSMVGISNFVTFLENTADYRRDLRRVKYGDEREPAMRKFLQDISPLTNVAKIQRPLFIIQGANDPRVPLSEAEQIQKGVQANGQEVWYMVAADEGHGFAKKANVDQYQVALVAFCERFLLS